MDKKEYQKQWREANKERVKELKKRWKEANKEKVKEQHKRYYNKSSKTEDGKKKIMIRTWKRIGLTDTDLDYIYDLYKNTTNCWVCNHDFSKYRKCLDHDHETGEFRQVLCHCCNACDLWKKYSEWL